MKNQSEQKKNFSLRPPIVTVLGHVDHGKTTLLDSIRKTNVVSKEHGGITQHIGAYQIEIVKNDKNEQRITFIDTPGHEAFAKMRGQGAKVSDIAILVVAGNDGVKPQTIESINHIKAAKIPFIIAINKIDIPDINLEKVKKQLSKESIELEEYGGDTPIVLLSAKTGKNIDKLLQTIILLSDLYQIGKKDHEEFEAVVIESSLSKHKGPVATIMIRSGKIHKKDEVVNNDQKFKIRAIIDWQGNQLESASSGDPVEILGWKALPDVGSILHKKEKSGKAEIKKKEEPKPPKKIETEEESGEEKKLNVIIKADTHGTLEAIISGFTNDIDIVSKGVGQITESDILLAKTTGSIIIGFNTNPNDNVERLARIEKVLLKTYKIIYELFDEIKEVAEALKKGDLVEVLGEAKIQALFPIKGDLIAGVKVISGRIAKGDKVKIVRNKEEIARVRIKTLKFRKEDISKAEQGKEAGVLLSQKVDLLTEDSIISIG